jgi:hypothetical protein
MEGWGSIKKTNEWCVVKTLAMGLQPMQGLAKVQAKSEAWESHFMLLGM